MRHEDLILIFIGHVVAFGLLGTLILLLHGWCTSWRHPVISVVSTFIFLGLAAWVLAAATEADGVTIQISSPTEGEQRAGAWTSVQGTVIPADARVVVLVHPQKANKWWVQRPVDRAINGQWNVLVSFGDPHMQYQLVAVASGVAWYIDLLRGRLLFEGLELDRPPALPSSTVISVSRVDE